MKGNYQDEPPILKFSPEAVGVHTGNYYVQQCAEMPVDEKQIDHIEFEKDLSMNSFSNS